MAYREAQRAAHPGWHNAPVPSFGVPDAALLVVGMAPGVAGANRTGRPFTGDACGDLLYATLSRHGLANGRFAARPDDGLELHGTRITNAVRCVPPANLPTPAEAATCRQFLLPELTAAPAPRVVLALGGVAFAAVLRGLGLTPARFRFAHALELQPLGEAGPWLCASYHPSRYNVNTGKLTPAMLDAVVARTAALAA